LFTRRLTASAPPACLCSCRCCGPPMWKAGPSRRVGRRAAVRLPVWVERSHAQPGPERPVGPRAAGCA